MKSKIQTIIGVIIVGLLVVGVGRSIYNRNFAEPAFNVVKQSSVSQPVKNALFWHEQELEKTAFEVELTAESSSFTEYLYEELKNAGVLSEKIITMTKKATQKMIELDAYRGTEPNVWQMAKQQGYSYIFRVFITKANIRRHLDNVTYKFSIYDVNNKTLIWEGEIERMAGFFGGMPDNEQSVSVLKKHLKEAKIME